MKLKDLLVEVFEDEQPKINKREVIEGVKNYAIVGKELYNSGNIIEIAKQLSKIAESAHQHVLSETDDWFDKVSVNKNMKALKGNVVEFQKTAKEAHQLNQRLTAIYEDIGHTLNRYYDIDETCADKSKHSKKKIKEGDKEEYQAFFRKACEKFGLDPEDIDTVSDDKKKELFNYVDKNWSADKETD